MIVDCSSLSISNFIFRSTRADWIISSEKMPNQKGEVELAKEDLIKGAIQGSFANCNISLGLDLFNKGIIEYDRSRGCS